MTVALQGAPPAGVTVTAPPTVTVPGRSTSPRPHAASAPEGDVDRLRRPDARATIRRIPFWFRVESPKLGTEPHGASTGTRHVHKGQTRGKPSLVTSYRYPADAARRSSRPAGPEQVFRVTLTRAGRELRRRRPRARGAARFRPSSRRRSQATRTA